jgi:hypothetical protein
MVRSSVSGVYKCNDVSLLKLTQRRYNLLVSEMVCCATGNVDGPTEIANAGTHHIYRVFCC